MHNAVTAQGNPVETEQAQKAQLSAGQPSRVFDGAVPVYLNARGALVIARSAEQLFWQRVTKGPGCWVWRGALVRVGSPYGRLRWRGKQTLAHRAAWEMTFGEIPNGRYVCHHCDNPQCVRPDHLFLGTARMNVLDSIFKGRRPKADSASLLPPIPLERAELRARLVAAIRASGPRRPQPGTAEAIALRYGGLR
jgi:hypothetical protein